MESTLGYDRDIPSDHLIKEMAMVSALAEGLCVGTVPKTYHELQDIVPDEDPITPMVAIFSSLVENGKNVEFIVYDSFLNLVSEDGSITLDQELDIQDGPIDDLSNIHLFAPLYKDVPDSIETLSLTLRKYIDRLGGEHVFRKLLISPFKEWCKTLISMIPKISNLEILSIILRSISYMRIRYLMERLLLLLDRM